MSKYNIEGNMNFYDELYKSLDNVDEYKNDVCLITNEPLTENYVTLECNHKFNYIPLFNDIKNHKKKFNNLEAFRLTQNEIRCPYCRHKQKKLLPYYESMGEEMKVLGVNVLPEPPPGWEIGICSFHEEGSEEMKYCSINVILLSDNKKYCKHHCHAMKCRLKKEAEKKEKQEAKQKEKEKVKKLKEELKQKVKEAKEQEKQKAKEEKVSKKKMNNTEDCKVYKNKKIKIETETETETETNNNGNNINENTDELKNDNENVVISSQTCIHMIKYGQNKGHQCKGKVYLMGICKRHYNLHASKNNSIENNSEINADADNLNENDNK